MSLKPKSQDGSTNGVACMGSECDAADRLRVVSNFGDISAPTRMARLLAGAHFRAASVFCRSQSPKLVNMNLNMNAVNSLLTDTLVSGQLYLRTPFQIPVLPPSQTLYLHISVSGHSLVSGRRHF